MKRTILDHTPDGLRRRLAEMERQVADLQRLRNPPPQHNAPSGGGKPYATIVVAPADCVTPGAAAADIVLTGSDDHVLLQQALDLADAAADGGKVLILDGTVRLGDHVEVPSYCVLEGMGQAPGDFYDGATTIEPMPLIWDETFENIIGGGITYTGFQDFPALVEVNSGSSLRNVTVRGFSVCVPVVLNAGAAAMRHVSVDGGHDHARDLPDYSATATKRWGVVASGGDLSIADCGIAESVWVAGGGCTVRDCTIDEDLWFSGGNGLVVGNRVNYPLRVSGSDTLVTSNTFVGPSHLYDGVVLGNLFENDLTVEAAASGAVVVGNRIVGTFTDNGTGTVTTYAGGAKGDNA